MSGFGFVSGINSRYQKSRVFPPWVFGYPTTSLGWLDDYGFNHSWDVSFDDGEQDFNSERADESDENDDIPPLETLDIFDNLDGEEIKLMFSENYGEEKQQR